jgi:anti-sigma regulatory factor (Ser/Thr protein kinase)
VIIGGWRGPGWRVVDADPRGAGQIRNWIRSAIARHGCPVDLDDAVLVTDELFVNALMHGPPSGRVLVGYCLWREGARIAVCDAGGVSTRPELRQADAGTEGGRGLHLVQELSAQWGSFQWPGAQVVWCDFGRPLHAPASDTWAWLRLVLAACPLSAPARPAARRSAGKLAVAGHDQHGTGGAAVPWHTTGRPAPVLRLAAGMGGMP